VGQLLTGGKQQGKVIEPRVASGGAGLAIFVENDEVLVIHTQARAEAVTVTEPQSEGVLIEGDRAVEVTDDQLDGPEAKGGR